MAHDTTELLTDLVLHVRQRIRSTIWRKVGAELSRESQHLHQNIVSEFDLSAFNYKVSSSNAIAVIRMIFEGSFYDDTVLLSIPSIFGDPSTAKRTVIQLTCKESLDSATVLIKSGMVFTYNIDPERFSSETRHLVFNHIAELCGFHPVIMINSLPVSIRAIANDKLEAKLLVVFLTSLAQCEKPVVHGDTLRHVLYRIKMMLVLSRLWKKGMHLDLLLDERNLLDHFRVLIGDENVFGDVVL